MPKFIGRETELTTLNNYLTRKAPSFIIINGRRRIGKSRLIDEFGKTTTQYHKFVGLPPDEDATTQSQINEFAKQMNREFKLPNIKFDDWGDIFWMLGKQIQTKKTLLVFDEISWMGSKDPTFLPKIKYFWDEHLSKQDNLVFIVCGSASSWIAENILSNTGFVGRISLTMTIEELPLSDCYQFWPKRISTREKLKILSVTGGIPKYLEEIDAKTNAEENIKRLCFSKGGLLTNEFNHIFNSIFIRDSTTYKKILISILDSPKTRQQIAKIINFPSSGRLSEYLSELILAGFITADYAWKIDSGKDSRNLTYRLKDNYIRFYLKYIEPNQSKIFRNGYSLSNLSALPEWSAIMGLQFENLVIANKSLIHKALNIKPENIISENPYFQRKNARQQGCQIDYLIQTQFDLYVFEIKSSKSPIGIGIIEEVEQKISRLAYPKRFSIRPVLIYLSEITGELEDSNYFAHIIDFSKL